MKPKIFLSHSKKDKKIIERIANDLKKCGIDVWYDEWEIPPGESIRKKIFEEGIVSCDLFFVYLTKNSIPSYWVQKELDGALIHEIKTNNSFLALFVDEDDSRESLSIDLKALNIPKFNNDNYLIPFGKLISRVWNAYLEKQTLQIDKNDIDSIKKSLKNKKYEFNGIEINLLEFLVNLKTNFADGINHNTLKLEFQKIFKFNKYTDWGEDTFYDKYKISDFTGKLILYEIIEKIKGQDLYLLTKKGIKFLYEIE